MSLQELKPRNYIPGGDVLHHSYEVMLRDHPEAFDVIVYPALPSEENEINSVDAPEITLLDRDERKQRYGEPFRCRAIIAPEDTLGFQITDSEMLEAFHGASEGINLLLSERGVRTFSLIQWLEYTDLAGEETTERTVYVASTRPIGRTMNTWNVHTCFPLFNEGDIPETENTTESDPESGQDNGQNGGQDMPEMPDTLGDTMDIPVDIDNDLNEDELYFDGFERVLPRDEDGEVGTL